MDQKLLQLRQKPKLEKLKIGIVGATGYTGIELIRLLDRHPNIKITKLFSNKTTGNEIQALYPHLKNKYSLTLEAFNPDLDSNTKNSSSSTSSHPSGNLII